MRSLTRTFILWVFILLPFLEAQAALKEKVIRCEAVFSLPRIEADAAPLRLLQQTSNHDLRVNEIESYTKVRTELQLKLESVKDPIVKEQVLHLLETSEFFDYVHVAPLLWDGVLFGQRHQFDFSRLYDSNDSFFSFFKNEQALPFKGFLSAKEYLRSQNPTVDANLLLKIHSLAMKGGVENVSADRLGKFRFGFWFGSVEGNRGITDRQLAEIESNPYLTFDLGRSLGSQVNETSVLQNISIWGHEQGTHLSGKSAYETQNFGKIVYPHILKSKIQTLDLIKQTHPELHKKIMGKRAELLAANAELFMVPRELEMEFIGALTANRFQQFAQDRFSLGSKITNQNAIEYIRLVAELQKDLVSIHPLSNGNGRSTRILMNYLLTKEGLPPARLLDPDADLNSPRGDWQEYVIKGVVNRVQLEKAFLEQLNQKLPLSNAAELLYPALPEVVKVDLKKEGKTDPVESQSVEVKVDTAQFPTFVKTLVELYPDLRAKLQTERLKTMSEFVSLFTEFYRSKTIRYIHSKDGDKFIKLRLIDEDFIESFGTVNISNPLAWKYKMDRWYDQTALVWRGLSSRSKEYSNDEIVDMFGQLSGHMASNQVVRSQRSGSQQELLELMKKDFDKYNQELLTGKLLEMADDHHKSGPRYGESYGYSTSKREIVGKAFAMGAMVVGKYGDHRDEAMQSQLKSRINVGAYRAQKDVDLGRLKPFASEFSYIYFRQAEVMGIGGADPNSIMIIQRIDAEGKVYETFARNPENPLEILLLDGYWTPEMGPLPKNQIKEKFNLGDLFVPIKNNEEPIPQKKEGLWGKLDELIYNFVK